MKRLERAVFRRFEDTFGHVIPKAGVGFVHFSGPGFGGAAGGQTASCSCLPTGFRLNQDQS